MLAKEYDDDLDEVFDDDDVEVEVLDAGHVEEQLKQVMFRIGATVDMMSWR